MTGALLAALIEARRAGRATVLATWLDGRDQRLVEPRGPGTPASGTPETDAGSDELAAAVARVIARDQTEVIETASGRILLEPHLGPLRLVIVGAVHVAQPLAQMATLVGFAVTIVDPRRTWATAARFPGQALVTSWPDVAVRELGLDARTAIVTLTHDPKLDDPALLAALATPVFYVGCLGSEKTHASRHARLAALGVSDDALARLRGPVGIRIGARTPAEIAVSILAEIVATRRELG